MRRPSVHKALGRFLFAKRTSPNSRPVAQWLEQRPHKASVVGPIPTWPTIFIDNNLWARVNVTPYETLNLKPEASEKDVKDAYRKAASAAHPDRNGGSTERMVAINAAYAVLGDAERRKHYDETGDSATLDIENHATQMLAQAFATAIERSGPVLPFVRQELKNFLSHLQAERKKSQERLDFLMPKRDKVRRKDGSTENLMKNILEDQITSVRAHLQKVHRGTKIGKRALQLLDAYEEDTPEPPKTKAHHFDLGDVFSQVMKFEPQ
jgi:curved DNA-binding protein CbpA